MQFTPRLYATWTTLQGVCPEMSEDNMLCMLEYCVWDDEVPDTHVAADRLYRVVRAITGDDNASRLNHVLCMLVGDHTL